MEQLLELIKRLITGNTVKGTAIALPMSRSGIYGSHVLDYQPNLRADEARRSEHPVSGII